MSVKLSRAGREEPDAQALLSCLHGSGNVAINTPVRREGPLRGEHSRTAPALASRLLTSSLILPLSVLVNLIDNSQSLAQNLRELPTEQEAGAARRHWEESL